MDRDRTVYVKDGKRYRPLGYEFTGFPSNGVWLVEDGSRSLIMRVGDIPDPMPLARLMVHKQEFIKALSAAHKEWQNTPLSLHEIADRLLKALAAEVCEEENAERQPKNEIRGARW